MQLKTKKDTNKAQKLKKTQKNVDKFIMQTNILHIRRAPLIPVDGYQPSFSALLYLIPSLLQ